MRMRFRTYELRQALALLTIAVSGWLTSWAIDAANSPRVVTRVTCASSAWDFQ
jgi:hypothetical protein